MAKRRPTKQRSPKSGNASSRPIELRIVGGRLRASKIPYLGDPRTRPMKDRVREAVFNLLGPAIKGGFAIDLFAGTGALGLEAISRGASQAVFIERHFPTAAQIEKIAQSLGVEDRVTVTSGDTFGWINSNLPQDDTPWVVFCSPPYDFYIERREAMLTLLQTLLDAAPEGSQFVVESDQRFPMSDLPDSYEWSIRHYSPAVVAVGRRLNA